MPFNLLVRLKKFRARPSSAALSYHWICLPSSANWDRAFWYNILDRSTVWEVGWEHSTHWQRLFYSISATPQTCWRFFLSGVFSAPCLIKGRSRTLSCRRLVYRRKLWCITVPTVPPNGFTNSILCICRSIFKSTFAMIGFILLVASIYWSLDPPGPQFRSSWLRPRHWPFYFRQRSPQVCDPWTSWLCQRYWLFRLAIALFSDELVFGLLWFKCHIWDWWISPGGLFCLCVTL